MLTGPVGMTEHTVCSTAQQGKHSMSEHNKKVAVHNKPQPAGGIIMVISNMHFPHAMREMHVEFL
jgi:hypothetical protein